MQSPENVSRFLDAFLAHEVGDRLRGIEAPALVMPAASTRPAASSSSVPWRT